jgi:hypothetical protein
MHASIATFTGDPAGLLARYDAMLADESLDAISDGARVTRGAVA